VIEERRSGDTNDEMRRRVGYEYDAELNNLNKECKNIADDPPPNEPPPPPDADDERPSV
jgi:hypothetical protein